MDKPSPTVSTLEEAQVVIVEWKDLISGLPQPEDENDDDSPKANLSSLIEEAFGSSGTGILAIRNVPGFIEAKASCLPLAHKLAHLPKDYIEETLVDEGSLYNAGWSHGKEKLGDQPDFNKASFYYNPIAEVAGTEQDRVDFPLSYPRNRWPHEKLPALEPAAKKLGKILKDAAVAVSYHIDSLAHTKVPDYPASFLFDLMKDTDKVKGRLLYYYPLPQSSSAGVAAEEPNTDSWIGWHNDSGFLTALAGDIYLDHSTGQILDNCPDPNAGLYVVDRQNRTLHVSLPPDCLAVQVGECTQIVTAGVVTATPHCVRGTTASVARVSLPCFVDVPPSFPLHVPSSGSRHIVLDASHPSLKVPPLEKRWTTDGMAFGSFLDQTFRMYYDWKEDLK